MGYWGNKDSVGGSAGRQGGSNRGSGAFWGPGFDGLYTQKRSTDQESMARRHSLADQYKTGFVSKAWHRYVSGHAGISKPT